MLAMPLADYLGTRGPLQGFFTVTTQVLNASVPFIEIGPVAATVLFVISGVLYWVAAYVVVPGPELPVILDSMAGDWQEEER